MSVDTHRGQYIRTPHASHLLLLLALHTRMDAERVGPGNMCVLKVEALQRVFANSIPFMHCHPCCYSPLLLLLPPGVFRATRLRLNPRQRAAHALFKTYIDVVHVDKEEGDKLFKQRTGAEVSRG